MKYYVYNLHPLPPKILIAIILSVGKLELSDQVWDKWQNFQNLWPSLSPFSYQWEFTTAVSGGSGARGGEKTSILSSLCSWYLISLASASQLPRTRPCSCSQKGQEGRRACGGYRGMEHRAGFACGGPGRKDLGSAHCSQGELTEQGLAKYI